MKTTIGATSAMMFLVGLAAAAGIRATPVRSADTDVCSLLSVDDASAALGAKVGAPKPIPGHDMGQGAKSSGCEYSSSGARHMTLNVIHMPVGMAAMYQSLCEKKNRDGLTELGAVACWYNADHEELQVLKGLTFFSIELRGTGNPTERIKAVAKRVFDRI